MRVKLHTVTASNNRDHTPRSLYYCLFASQIHGVVLRAHCVRGEPRVQRNASGVVATVPIGDGVFYSVLCIVHMLHFFTDLRIEGPLNIGSSWL